MRYSKNGFLIMLAISIICLMLFYGIRSNTQLKLDYTIRKSLELNQQAENLLSEGKANEANELLLKSLSLNKLNADTFILLAHTEMQIENYQAAYDYFISVLNMEAISVEIVINTVDILIRSGHYMEAEKILNHGLVNIPHAENLLLIKARLNLLIGNYSDSIKILLGLLESENINKDNIEDIYMLLGLNYYFNGNEEEALRFYNDYNFAVDKDKSNKESIEELHQIMMQIWGDKYGK